VYKVYKPSDALLLVNCCATSFPNKIRNGHTTSHGDPAVSDQALRNPGTSWPLARGTPFLTTRDAPLPVAQGSPYPIARDSPFPTALNTTPSMMVDRGPSPVTLAYDMSDEAFKQYLKILNIPFIPPPTSFGARIEEEPTWEILPLLTKTGDYRTGYIYRALADLSNTRSLGPHWATKDYDTASALALALERKQLSRSALLWSRNDALVHVDGGWTPERAFTATAITAYMAQEWLRAEASGDDDLMSDVGNDNMVLFNRLMLSYRENPCAPAHQ
jgi:hypothetical protein